MKQRAIIVTGSRRLRDYGPIIEVFGRIPPPYPLIIHGAARGVDSLAAEYCRGAGMQVVAMPASWKLYGDAAGGRRNRKMLDVGLALRDCGWEVEVDAFPCSASVGTWGMKRIAEEADVLVRVHHLGELSP